MSSHQTREIEDTRVLGMDSGVRETKAGKHSWEMPKYREISMSVKRYEQGERRRRKVRQNKQYMARRKR